MPCSPGGSQSPWVAWAPWVKRRDGEIGDVGDTFDKPQVKHHMASYDIMGELMWRGLVKSLREVFHFFGGMFWKRVGDGWVVVLNKAIFEDYRRLLSFSSASKGNWQCPAKKYKVMILRGYPTRLKSVGVMFGSWWCLMFFLNLEDHPSRKSGLKISRHGYPADGRVQWDPARVHHPGSTWLCHQRCRRSPEGFQRLGFTVVVICFQMVLSKHEGQTPLASIDYN